MIIKFAKRAFFGRETEAVSSDASKKSATSELKASNSIAASATRWEDVLTQSLKENALAPSDEVILHAYNLYCDELNAPFVKRRRAMNERFSNVIAEFAALQALAPDMIERAAAKHRLELDRFLEKKGHKS